LPEDDEEYGDERYDEETHLENNPTDNLVASDTILMCPTQDSEMIFTQLIIE